MKMHEVVQKIENKEDFLRFLDELQNDLKTNPDEWENKDLTTYLQAMKAWVEDMNGYFRNQKIELPNSIPWKLFAQILLASKVYE
jgi:hypothetical protein